MADKVDSINEVKLNKIKDFLNQVKEKNGKIDYESIFSATSSLGEKDSDIANLLSGLTKENYNKIASLDGNPEDLSAADLEKLAAIDGDDKSLSTTDLILNNNKEAVNFEKMSEGTKKSLIQNLNRFEMTYQDFRDPQASDGDYNERVARNYNFSKLNNTKLKVQNDAGDFTASVPESENVIERHYVNRKQDAFDIDEKIAENTFLRNKNTKTPALIKESETQTTETTYSPTAKIGEKFVEVQGKKYAVLSEKIVDKKNGNETLMEYDSVGKKKSETFKDIANATEIKKIYDEQVAVSSVITTKNQSKLAYSNGKKVNFPMHISIEQNGQKKNYEMYSPFGDKAFVYFEKGKDGKSIKGTNYYFAQDKMINCEDAKKLAEERILGKVENRKKIEVEARGKKISVDCDPDSVSGKSIQFLKDICDGKIMTVDKNGNKIPLKDADDIFARKEGIKFDGLLYEAVHNFDKMKLKSYAGAGSAARASASGIEYDTGFVLESSEDNLIRVTLHELGHPVYTSGGGGWGGLSKRTEMDVDLIGELYKEAAGDSFIDAEKLARAKYRANELGSNEGYDHLPLNTSGQTKQLRNFFEKK